MLWSSGDLWDINKEWSKNPKNLNPIYQIIRTNAMNLLLPNNNSASYRNMTIYQQRYGIWNTQTLNLQRCSHKWNDKVGQVRTGTIDINWFYLIYAPLLIKACCIYKIPGNIKKINNWWLRLSKQINNLNRQTPPTQKLPNGSKVKPNQTKYNYLEDLVSEWNNIQNRLKQLNNQVEKTKNKNFNQKYQEYLPSELKIKQLLYMGFHLIRNYYFGYNKQRERTTNCFFGNLSSTTPNPSNSGQLFNGDLSAYVGWIDIYLNKTYMLQNGVSSYNICNKTDYIPPTRDCPLKGYFVKNPNTEWRGPFPYFLGNNTWLVFHGLVNSGKLLSKNGKNKLISIFSKFITSFIPTSS